MEIVIAIPVYEDWDSATLLCQQIDTVFCRETAYKVSIFLIDDGSVRQRVVPSPRNPFKMFRS